ncbi:AVAST type 4 anti-phage nuclease Avs4 [Methanobacterium sp.]
MEIIKPDWDKFKAKFSENHQDNFEWFCNLLFCKEFNQPFGIFRYKNQSGIETDPIIKEDEVIGWQAKFYETTLSSHKKDLIETIRRTKRDYPDITKIILYSNQEWVQRLDREDKAKKPPKGLIEIEEKAESLQIEIDWRTMSFFESSFVTIDNKIIAQHFFSLDQSIIGLVNEKKLHNDAVFHEIQTDINFNDQKIEIDRSEILQNIENELRQKQILIISGVGGVGKTAVIKNFYKKIGEETPFYVFKANEFNLNNLNDLFNGLNFRDFIDFHDNEKIKIIVIDSAEKLLELPNTDIFKEFLLNLIKNNWKIIFTTRNNYLEDLNYQFIDIYNINPFNLDITNLDESDLENLSSKYSFSLPEDSKLSDLIKNPFYLNEYLRFYNEKETLNYSNFKEKLWNNIIKRSKPSREQCFLKTAFERANQSQFFVNPDCDSQILDNFVQDGILGYETAGYFITHDIYEEWALEKIINSEFIKKQNNEEFFEKIGESLPVRRSFRNWVSEKLLLENGLITQFIEEIIQDEEIKYFWKDEILVSVLLSDYSEAFFELFKEKLIENDQKFLKKVTLLLRIACKEVDNDFFQALSIKEMNSLPITYFFTKPKGNGWKNLIKFVYQNLESIKIENITFIFPIIHDWNSKFKKGETTRFSSLIALKYYEWVIEEDKYLDKKIEEKILQTILFGASEIKDELIIIFDKILENKWDNHRDHYNELINAILTKVGVNMEVIKVLPEYVLRLADLFWFKNPKKDDFHNSGHQGDLPFIDDPLDIEGKFCLKRNDMDYFPSSSFQTPIYWLLLYSFEKTINFILNFTNKTIKCYAKSDLGKGELFKSGDEEIFNLGKEKVEEIDVFIVNGKTTKQYIDDTIWNMYRGTKNSPNVLQSMHMALEKFFLENAEKFDPEVLESWLLYLLVNAKSASITAIIASIVLAFPDKTFNVAKVLFQTKEFFIYDTVRWSLENTAEGIYSIGYGLNSQRNFYQDERIKTCKDEHRKKSLESLALFYQVFRNEQISEEEVEKRQHKIWDIFDEYYNDLPNEKEETDSDKTWRLYLARMDSRKIVPKIEKKDDHVLIKFITKLGSKLKEFSQRSTDEMSEKMKYMPLKMWASYKIGNDDRYNEFKQYKDPKLVLKDLKEVVNGFKSNDLEFHLFYHSIPGDACSVLVRDYSEEISKDEISYCKNIILECASASLRENYGYQLGDGVKSAISVLPLLLEKFPEEKEVIKFILLLTLFDPQPMGVGSEFCDYSKLAIINLWNINFEDTQSLLLGYLWLKPKYEELRAEIRKKNYGKNVYEVYEIELIKEFDNKYEKELQKVIKNEITINDLNEIEKQDSYVLKTAFQLIPSKTEHTEHKELAKTIISTFAKDLLSNKREDKIDYWTRHIFLEKLADFVLNSSKQDISNYLKPFIDNFNSSEDMANLFKEFAYAEDRLDVYDNFWEVWDLFYEKIVEICNKGDNYYTKKVIKGYLFAENIWKKEATHWHTFKEEDKRFFKKLTENTGQCPSVLYSISKLLNGIGSLYVDDGILWISRMLNVYNNLWSDELETNTVYYLENIVRRYENINSEKLRKNTQLKQQFLVILDFLIEKESVVGYMLRETIL